MLPIVKGAVNETNQL